MAEIARELNRQIGILVDRRGHVTHVIVGDAHRIFIPDLTRHRAGSGRFRGLRLLHTHLRGEGLTQDDLTASGVANGAIFASRAADGVGKRLVAAL